MTTPPISSNEPQTTYQFASIAAPQRPLNTNVIWLENVYLFSRSGSAENIEILACLATSAPSEVQESLNRVIELIQKIATDGVFYNEISPLSLQALRGLGVEVTPSPAPERSYTPVSPR